MAHHFTLRLASVTLAGVAALGASAVPAFATTMHRPVQEQKTTLRSERHGCIEGHTLRERREARESHMKHRLFREEMKRGEHMKKRVFFCEVKREHHHAHLVKFREPEHRPKTWMDDTTWMK